MGGDPDITMSRDGKDQEGIRDRAARERRGSMTGMDPDAEGGGMMARWQARLRLQRDQRSGQKDRRSRPRPDQTPDRRLAV